MIQNSEIFLYPSHNQICTSYLCQKYLMLSVPLSPVAIVGQSPFAPTLTHLSTPLRRKLTPTAGRKG